MTASTLHIESAEPANLEERVVASSACADRDGRYLGSVGVVFERFACGENDDDPTISIRIDDERSSGRIIRLDGTYMIIKHPDAIRALATALLSVAAHSTTRAILATIPIAERTSSWRAD